MPIGPAVDVRVVSALLLIIALLTIMHSDNVNQHAWRIVQLLACIVKPKEKQHRVNRLIGDVKPQPRRVCCPGSETVQVSPPGGKSPRSMDCPPKSQIGGELLTPEPHRRECGLLQALEAQPHHTPHESCVSQQQGTVTAIMSKC